ncbi:glycosyltransferase family 61 protein [Sphingomonas sp.]|uniref:glycosyltransferase family 61 protein n=1 Tax=Sphingomonas sp. TaxID=28214 RepID=UPI000DB5D416|nr:glycosyltransferase family 61 protein [Sphingomonas sp.]PZU07964.1 MAG: hypothetical protein DI605_13865 [Sphingomonas sp.]
MPHVEIVPPFTTGAHWLIGAETLLIDRVVPAVERMWLPPAYYSGGTITVHDIERGAGLAPTRGGLRMLRHKLRADRPPEPVSGLLVDMREGTPQNFHHSISVHLPMCEVARRVLDAPFTVVLPSDTPGYVRRVFGACGYPIVTTEYGVPGDIVRVERDNMYNMLRDTGTPPLRRIAEAILASRPGGERALPARVFLARRGTRFISNQAEIEAVLAPLGYETVYPEDLSVSDQFRLLGEATHVVAIHGAGMGPLLYRDPARGPIMLVEILPAAHMTNVHRYFLDGVGGVYVGVRGRITPADAAAAYAFGEMYTANSLKPFEVDPVSLRVALDLAQEQFAA